MKHLLASQYEDVKNKVPVYSEVKAIMVEDYKVEMSTVLWDSGALHSSYISQHWVDRHREALQNRIRKEETMVRLGDSMTRVHLKEKLSLEIEATSPVNTLCRRRAVIDFCIMVMKGMDGIIGLPDIIGLPGYICGDSRRWPA